jgi:hypothetical protein
MLIGTRGFGRCLQLAPPPPAVAGRHSAAVLRRLLRRSTAESHQLSLHSLESIPVSMCLSFRRYEWKMRVPSIYT